jgi:predicted transcriptional regulator YheO
MSEQATVCEAIPRTPIERVQLGVRIEKRMAQVLKGLAEFTNMTLGQLIEEIVLHSFEPVEGHEGQMCASPHSARSLQAITDLKKVYGMDYDTHSSYGFEEKGLSAGRSAE